MSVSASTDASLLQRTSDPFQWSAAVLQLVPGTSADLVLTLSVPTGSYVYRDQLEVVVAQVFGLKVGEPVFPKAILRADPAEPEKLRALYDDSVVVRVPLMLVADGGQVPRLVLTITQQGCVPGLCYPRRQRQLQPTLIAPGGDEATATQ